MAERGQGEWGIEIEAHLFSERYGNAERFSHKYGSFL